MPVTLSIKNVPDRVAALLRQRAKVNRRSLQGELLAIVEGIAVPPATHAMTVEDLHEWAKAQGFPKIGDAAADIRRMRDERTAQLARVFKVARVARRPRARKNP